MGKAAELTPEKLRTATAEVSKFARQKGAETLDFVIPEAGALGIDAAVTGQAIAEGSLLGLYTFRKHMTNSLGPEEVKQVNIMTKQITFQR